MKLEAFIDKVTELANDSEIKKQLEKGLKIQLTISKDKANIVALKPKTTRQQSKN